MSGGGAPENDVLTAKEVAVWLKVSPKQVRRLPIPCSVLGPRSYRYQAKDVQAYLDRMKVRAA